MTMDKEQFYGEAANWNENYNSENLNEGTFQGAAESEAEYKNFDRKPPSKRKDGKKVIAILLIILLSAGAGFGGGVAAMYFSSGLSSIKGNSNLTIKTDSNINTAEAVAQKVIPSVVGISTKTQVTYQSFFGEQTQTATGVGTGIIVDSSGYILTNSHVVSDGSAQAITVQLADGKDVQGKVLWNDPTIDLAVVKIDAKNLVAAELGDSEDVNVGAYAVAIGNPLGMAFERSVTQGVISGLNRSISVTEGQKTTTIDGLIQTDASINSGNSGGPLLNSKGQVIGINTAKAQSGEGLGFAIPINTAKPIVQQIISKGEFNRSYIGIKGVSIQDLIKAYPDQKFDSDKGAYVVQIYTDSPAAKAGLKEEDIIVGANDKEIDTMTQLISYLYQYRPGDTVKLKVMRHGRTLVKDVTLTEMPKER